MKYSFIIFALILLIALPLTSTAQIKSSIDSSQKIGKYTVEEWKTVIDSTWGEGLPTADKLQIFDLYWNAVDADYGGFVNLDVNWDSLKNAYRPEVEDGVSRGRFAAIMNQLSMALMEIHTHCNDTGVREDSLHPGYPLLAHYCAYMPYDNGHFGAGLTPLPDSSAFVYKVVDNHPLGLEMGDIVLGYDGIPWKYLYQELLAAELPIAFPNYLNVGTSERSVSHVWLMSAGLNWHLFDTIDILKYSTNDTVHLPTSNLISQDMHIYCSEQLPVPGVPMVDLSNWGENTLVSWGIVEDTKIGYIYVYSWYEKEGNAFGIAVNEFIDNYKTTGLILDFRTNSGGGINTANEGFRRLFNLDQNAFHFVERSDPNDHFAMESTPLKINKYKIYTDNYLYDRPIAVLTGPFSFCGGDFNAVRLKYHPMTRFFGKPTNSAFSEGKVGQTNNHNVLIPFVGWEAGYVPMNTYLVTNPDNYLMHVGFEVDEDVWLTQEDVTNGEDTVVKRAIEWIKSLAYAHDVTVDKSYLQPEIDSILVTTQVENPHQHELSLVAEIKNMNDVFIDSLNLYDNGMHGDDGFGDNLWGNFYFVKLSEEQSYTVSVTTNDLTDATSRIIPNVAWFTTIGPIKVSSYQITSPDSIPNHGDLISYKLTLRNEGQTATAINITTNLIALDSCASITGFPDKPYGDIAPGETAVHSGSHRIQFNNFNTGCPDPMSVKVLVEISSNGFVFWYDTLEIVTDIEESMFAIPKSYALHQNYPNPFNPITKINYQLPITNYVELSIYNLLGQKVATLVSKKQNAGYHQVEWNASGFASGVYYYQLVASDYKEVKKMILLK